jgi:hypothetical protein
MNHKPLRSRIALLILAFWASTNSICRAQAVEAYAGSPFGVGKVSLRVGGAGPMTPVDDDRFSVATDDGRVLYPVISEDRARRLLRRVLEIDRPRSITIYFLFRGNEPFELKAYAPNEQQIRVTPLADPVGHAQLLAQWWEQYGNRWQSLQQDRQFPPIVENFLAANLARRLGLTLPVAQSGLFAALAPKKAAWDDLLLTEQHELTIDRELVSTAVTAADALEPLPPQMPWYDLPAATEEQKAVPVETLAAHVPVECFYLRFGTFPNYLWFRDLEDKWQGDLGNMILRRGIERAAADRVQQQLALYDDVMSKIMGPTVIQDVAIIGLDPYLNQGAAIGILFHARSTPLLTRDLTGKRLESLTKFNGAAESTIRVGDRDVSLIATPAGDVRSYYVADGDFHLVTTSKHLIQRFLQAGAGDRALAASAGFLGVRQRIPHDRGDAVFAYASPEFFRELTSPAVWIEAQRRFRAQREVQVRRLAQFQALAEGVATDSEMLSDEALVAGGLLPAGFAMHADGSGWQPSEAEGDHLPIDTLRGKLGFFVPVSDVEVTGATATEAAAYRRFSDRFRQEVGQMPPIAVGIQRIPLTDGSGETMSADVVATPLDGLKLGRLPDILGEPSGERVGPVEGDVARVEFVLDQPPIPLLGGGGDELHHVFAGVRDFRTPLVVERGRVGPGASRAELVRMYVGAWPKPGILSMFAGPQTEEGLEPAPGGAEAWQAKKGDFLLMSFKPDLVQEVLPQLEMTPAVRPAQVWANVTDLTGKQLLTAVNALGYQRTRETSVAASRLMNSLANQLHVPREQCLGLAEQLMGGQFVCALGGEYQLVEVPGGVPTWTSTAIAPQNRFLLTEAPADFMLPVLTWFKGLRGDLTMLDDELSAHIEVDMAKSAVP